MKKDAENNVFFKKKVLLLNRNSYGRPLQTRYILERYSS